MAKAKREREKDLVVHCKKDAFDVYVGRPRTNTPHHFGNPFTFKAGTKALVVLSEGEDCIEAFRLWLLGEHYDDVEPERRQWIMDNLHTLKGKVLGCWCRPQACHADVLVQMANR